MDQGDRALVVEGAQHRKRDAVVTADHEGKGAGLQDLAHRGFRVAIARPEIARIGEDVAAIHHADRLIHQQRAADVEVVPFEGPDGPIGRLADRSRAVRLVVGDVLDRVGRAERDAQHGDIRLQGIEVGDDFGEQQALVAVLRGGGERGRHGCLCGVRVIEGARCAAGEGRS